VRKGPAHKPAATAGPKGRNGAGMGRFAPVSARFTLDPSVKQVFLRARVAGKGGSGRA